MQFLICFLLPLCGVLGTLQMDKDLQYNCYYQILKKYSTKSNYDYDDDIVYNRRLEDTTQSSNIYAASSTESQLERMRREIFKDHDETSSIHDLHPNDLDKTFSSAYAEPRNSGNYKQDIKSARSSFNGNSIKISANETSTFSSKEVTYFIVASQTLRAGFVYKVYISVLQANYPIKAFANISCDGVNLSGDSIDVYAGGSETLNLHLGANTLSKRACKLRLEGFFLNYYCDLAFLNEYALEYAQSSQMILIQTDKPLYMQGDTLRFRVTVMNADFQPSECIVEIYLIDPHEHITWRWLTPLSSSGTISLEHKLADRPIFGVWTISVSIAEQGGQQKQTYFTVEEFYRTRCEVEINMPAVFFTTSAFIKGTVTATTTNSGSESVNGNLTLIATFYPLGYLNRSLINKQYRLGMFDKIPNTNISPEFYKHPKELLNRTAYILHENKKSARYNSDFLSHGRQLFQQTVTQFNGSYSFKWSKFELDKLQANMTAVEILVTARVAADNGDELCLGYAISRIYKPTMRISFLGGSTQIFKPTLPFTVLIVAEYINGSPLDSSLLTEGQMELRGVISTKSEAGKLSWPKRRLQMLHHRSGIWELKIDLRNDLPQLQRDILNSVTEMRLQATFTVERQAGTKRAHNTTKSAELQLVAHFSPRNQYIKVYTSTEQPTVGEYIIFEINTNFFVEHFHYMVIAKGVILVSEHELLSDGMRTIALVLSAEMSPYAEIIVWAVTWEGQIVADSLTFPVAGMFQNNFTVTIENTHQNEPLPISVLGEAGTYVSLTAVARDIYNMQPDGFGLTFTAFITEMQTAYNNTSKLYKHGWYMHKEHNAHGKYDNVYYPASTFGLDANSTFAQSGLIVLTDGVVPNTAEQCKQMGFVQCLIGSCYFLAKKCDGFRDCIDGSDEVACEQVHQHLNDLGENQNYRSNRVFRHYQNAVWLWKDIQIDSTGRSKFYANEPSNVVPSQWIINGYSTRLAKGLGVISKVQAYTSQKTIVVKVDMSGHCRKHEHIGIRVNIFKNTNTSNTVTVTLRKSADYVLVTNKYLKFPVHLTAHEHQRTLLMSIMPISLGKIDVVLFAQTSDSVINITSYLNVQSSEFISHPRGWHKSILLNLTEQRSHIVEHLSIPRIPHNHVHISLVENAISVFIGKPSTSSTSLETAEECALALATNLYSLIYLRLMTNKQNSTAEKDIYFHMNENYQRLLSFMRPDGSFSNFLPGDWNHLDSSVWLTAHCLRLIQKAAAYKMIDYIWIDVTIIEANLNWLLQQQTSEGAWLQTGTTAEDNKTKMTLTAHVLIAFCTLQNLSDTYALRVEEAKSNAVAWIEQNWHTHLNTAQPYDIALTTYALLLCKSTIAENTLPILHGLARRSMESYIYWSSNDLEKSKLYSQRNAYNSLDIETTAYALLTYLKRGDAQTEAIANWLNEKCLFGHSLTSARATSAAMHALLEFYAYSRRHENSGTMVELLASSTQVGTIKEILYLNNSIGAQLQSIEFDDVVGILDINAKGTVSGILHVHFDTDADKVAQSSATPAFRINNKASFHGRQGSHITYTICIKWINAQPATHQGITILDVMIPTGYGIQQQTLDAYVRHYNVKHLLRAKYMETKIIFYFIDLAEEDTCVQFTIKRWYPVANITRFLPIRVYNYNAPEHFAYTMFDALPLHRLNIKQVFATSSCTNCLDSSSSNIVINVKLLSFTIFILCVFIRNLH